jgi:D-alanyl-D-alanine carboxypeptidase/D-alanyl-D-alanine-endopeptidase (penicillin-binding protein 4)
MMRRSPPCAAARLLAAWLLALVIAGCAPKAPPRVPALPPPAPAPAPVAPPVAHTPPAPVPPAAPPAATVPATTEAVEHLRAELDRIFLAPALDRMLWSIQVQSLATGEVLYRLNPLKLVMPASNMKIVTLAAAAERLGWDFTYETKLLASGPIEGGVLRGDLVVVGSGDPTVNARGGSATAVFESWAVTLREAGITAIEGRIIADDHAFSDETLGAGWAWDYLVYGYAAPVTALQYRENIAEVVVRPGSAAGLPAVVFVRPDETGLAIENHAVTLLAGGTTTVEVHRMAGSDRLQVTGAIPLGAAEAVRSVAVDNPARFFARALRSTLMTSGISVGGQAIAIRNLATAPDLTRGALLVSHRSAPLSEIAKVLMKVSQNLYAETLVKTLGLQTGAGTTEAGQKVVQEVIEGWGVAPGSYVLADGSGLSRYNFVCAETIVQILRHVSADARLRGPYLDALPVGGQAAPEGGTLSRRFRGTRAAGNVRAKTGSIANARALSGFVQTVDGETLVFSIIGNNFTQPQAAIDAAADLAVERLANFTRNGVGSN